MAIVDLAESFKELPDLDHQPQLPLPQLALQEAFVLLHHLQEPQPQEPACPLTPLPEQVPEVYWGMMEEQLANLDEPQLSHPEQPQPQQPIDWALIPYVQAMLDNAERRQQ